MTLLCADAEKHVLDSVGEGGKADEDEDVGQCTLVGVLSSVVQTFVLIHHHVGVAVQVIVVAVTSLHLL